jgi:hypothetical protein
MRDALHRWLQDPRQPPTLCFVAFLDWLASKQLIPYPSTPFIEWDRRDADDLGNEW